MKKTILQFINNIQINKRGYTIIALLLLGSYSFAQTITPVKTVTSDGCGLIKVDLEIVGTEAKSNADVVLVIDVSKSMNNIIAGDAYKPIYYAKKAAKSFIDAAKTNPNNRIAIVSYTTTAKLEIGLTYLDNSGVDALKNKIDALTAKDYTNIQDGIAKADEELNQNGRTDCKTSKSIVLLTDGATNRSGDTNSLASCANNPSTINTNCITQAIATATIAKNNSHQIFTIGLLGGLNNTVKSIAQATLQNIQSIGNSYAFETNTSADLTSIYTQIANQLKWVAKDFTVTESIPAGYTISTITSTSGTLANPSLPASGPTVITWTNAFLASTPISLRYTLIPDETNCGIQKVSATKYSYINSNCAPINDQTITTDDYLITCKPVITGNCTVCSGNSAIVYSVPNTTGSTYTWNVIGGTITSGQNTNSIEVAWETEGTGKVEVTQTSATCSTVSSQNVTINALPTLTFCKGFTKTCIDNRNGGNIGENAETGFTYSWTSTPAGFTSTEANPTVNPSETTTYTVTKTNTSTGCFASKDVTVTVNNLSVTANPGNPFTKTCIDKQNGGCIGEIADTEYTYSWTSLPIGFTSTEANPTVNPSETTTFTVIKTNNTTGCFDTKSVVVTVNNTAPKLEIANPLPVCSPTTIDITAPNIQTTNDGSSTKYYSSLELANTGGISDIATPTAISNSGTYFIRSEFDNGCFVVKAVEVTINSCSLALVKKSELQNTGSCTKVGDKIIYTFTVTNPGTTTINELTLTDTLLENINPIVPIVFTSGDDNNDLNLDPSETWIYKAEFPVNQSDIDTGEIINQAVINGKVLNSIPLSSLSGTDCTNQNPTITQLCQNSKIEITKDGTYVDTNGDGITNIGDIVTYAFIIKNTGNTTLSNVFITDNNATITGNTIATLNVGATDSTTFTGTHSITQEDINTGYVYNLAIVTGNDPKGNPVTDTSTDPTPCTNCPPKTDCPDCTIVILNPSPRLEITKTTSNKTFSKVGDIINYLIIVKNTGNQTLYQITVKDPLTGLETIIALLDPNATAEFTQTYTITQEDLNKGSVLNIATANGFTPNKTPIGDDDDEITNEVTNPIDAVDDNAGTLAGVNQITPNIINVFTNDTLNGIAVNPNDVILTTITPNPYLQLNPNGSIDLLPNAPVGVQTLTYQICEKLNNTNCDTAIVTVTIESPRMTITGESICINDVPYLNYSAIATNFTPASGLTLTWFDSNNNLIATMPNLPLSGKVLWPGAIIDENGNGLDWPGWIFANGKWAEAADGLEGLRPTATVRFSLNPEQSITVNYPPSDPYCTSRPKFKIDAVDDVSKPIDAINGATNVLNVFNNDWLNGSAVNPADVTLTLITPDVAGFMTMNPDGSIDLKNQTPEGIYTLQYQICENADNGNCDIATVIVPVICNNATKVSGVVYNAGNNALLANVPLTLTPITIVNGQNHITGPPLMRVTNSEGYYNFKGIPSGNYVLQVQDANLNSAHELFNTSSSFLIVNLEVCNHLIRNFGYDKTDLPVLGNFVWYDLNKNGLQDEWYDANNDGLVTQNIPDSNGTIDYSKWEWIDFNNDGSYLGKINEGELNAAGFGNGTTNVPNLFITGPNDYFVRNTIGLLGYWRVRPPFNAWGQYNVELKMESNLEASADAISKTGLVKILPNFSNITTKNTTANKTTAQTDTNSETSTICGISSQNPQSAQLSAENRINLDLDFGVVCQEFGAIDDVYTNLNCSTTGIIGNVLENDLLNGDYVAADLIRFTITSGNNSNITIDELGNITITGGLASGTYVYTYSLCDKINPNNCVTATITITSVEIQNISITETACNADSTPIDLMKFLPENINPNGTWIDINNSGGLIGNVLNTLNIPVNSYNYEYKISESCPINIAVSMNINEDCKVLPCASIIVHNAVSANEDGKNDYFQIENLENNECYKNFKVEIFNRWGILVFERENYDNGPNAFRGQSEGRTTINKNEGLPTGTYFYILSYESIDDVGNIQTIKKNGYLYLAK
ncbi:DUF7507 domain-containing protein [Flavobacterium adhaerens]|uniref:DUF7507 domain-containing protein n=1 Tax=Flavobacterium adhaerens TaxID=3149043 RepID=UPI0032B4B770